MHILAILLSFTWATFLYLTYLHNHFLYLEKYKQCIKRKFREFSLPIPLHSMEFYSIVDLLNGLIFYDTIDHYL